MATPSPVGGFGYTSSAPAAHPSGAEDLRLPKPPGFIRSYFNRHPWLLDGVIAGAYALPSAVVALLVFVASLFGATPFDFQDSGWRSTPLFGIALLYTAAAVTVALLFRRYVPVITAAICAASLLVTGATSQQLDTVPMMFALYALSVYRSTRSAWIWTAVAVVTGIVSTALYDPFDLAAIIGYGVLSAMAMVIATLVGITFGNRRRYIQALLDRAQQLARERDQQARLSAAAERARIAREMHDIVAHSLTVIVALSDGAEASVERSPATAREAMRQSAATARRALTDMRLSLGVLTEPDAEESEGAGAGGGGGGSGVAAGTGATVSLAGSGAGASASAASAPAPLMPQPSLDDLPEMIASYRAAGLPVRVTATGTPPRDPLVQLTVFRVVQEALTNALRYAVQATAVDVVLHYGPGGITVEVSDDGIDPGRGAASVGSSRGLIGMRERVTVYGGSVSAGPAGTRGWRVRAALAPPNTTLTPAAPPPAPSHPATSEGENP
ncbi:sensor histidine kinase [Herbiconiux ginsengi]|uniref:histidine kinase n=1 Tax=Herbiconiux ginsengi TaxID=381665 RepID=A0A1H3L1W9_9MICO|nr:sensor histidine kinase [Herbiconiux ginsengi]SDY58422.1 Signal transduction histidine kinase [Herbiconiux ginsengi]